MPDPAPSAQPPFYRDSSQRLVNTNDALQKALKQLPASERNRLILRCDDLPVVNGSEAAYENVFFHLLKLTLEESKDASAVFLHINCMGEEIDSLKPTEHKQFNIQFNTSIAASADWQKKHEQQIADIETLLKKNGAVLLVNRLKSAGLVFSISLPGKTL